MSEWHISNKRLRIDHLIHMADEPLCIDTLMDSACECMELCRDRGLNIESETKMVNKAFDEARRHRWARAARLTGGRRRGRAGGL